MKQQVKNSVDSLSKETALDQPSGMIIELEGAVLEQIAGGDGGMEPKSKAWAV